MLSRFHPVATTITGRLLLALLPLLAACSGSDGTEPEPPEPGVTAVIISPRGLTLPVGGRGQLSAAARNAQGNDVSATISWSSRDQAIASASSGGEVSGNRAGLTQVIASARGRADTVDVLVVDNSRLVVSPPAADVNVGSTVQFTVQAVDGAGNPVATPAVTWSSSATGIATISGSGLARGVAPGVTSITARAGTLVSQPAVLTVRDNTASTPCDGIGNIEQFEATVDYGFKAVGLEDGGGARIDADDMGHLTATMTRMIAGPITASWSGPISGNASVTQRRTGGSSVTTFTGGGPIIPQPPFGTPQMTFIVNLSTCTYWIRAAAVIQTRLTDPFGSRDGPDQVAQVQFAGPLGAWRQLGIFEENSGLPAHSLVWGGENLNVNAVFPLGIVTGLFDGNGGEPPRGQGTGGLLILRR